MEWVGLCHTWRKLVAMSIFSYIDHFSFFNGKAGVNAFLDAAFVGYDRHIVDQFINGESEGFVAGDLFGVALHFQPGNVLEPKVPFKSNRGIGFHRGGRPGWFDQDQDRDPKDLPQTPTPRGFPDDVCYKFNYRICTGKCSKLHVCRICRGNHKASSGQCNQSLAK